ncbi:MAG: hypothetical protein U0Z75_07345 [Deinococcaceae bacterium]
MTLLQLEPESRISWWKSQEHRRAGMLTVALHLAALLGILATTQGTSADKKVPVTPRPLPKWATPLEVVWESESPISDFSVKTPESNPLSSSSGSSSAKSTGSSVRSNTAQRPKASLSSKPSHSASITLKTEIVPQKLHLAKPTLRVIPAPLGLTQRRIVVRDVDPAIPQPNPDDVPTIVPPQNSPIAQGQPIKAEPLTNTANTSNVSQQETLFREANMPQTEAISHNPNLDMPRTRVASEAPMTVATRHGLEKALQSTSEFRPTTSTEIPNASETSPRPVSNSATEAVSDRPGASESTASESERLGSSAQSEQSQEGVPNSSSSTTGTGSDIAPDSGRAQQGAPSGSESSGTTSASGDSAGLNVEPTSGAQSLANGSGVASGPESGKGERGLTGTGPETGTSGTGTSAGTGLNGETRNAVSQELRETRRGCFVIVDTQGLQQRLTAGMSPAIFSESGRKVWPGDGIKGVRTQLVNDVGIASFFAKRTQIPTKTDDQVFEFKASGLLKSSPSTTLYEYVLVPDSVGKEIEGRAQGCRMVFLK